MRLKEIRLLIVLYAGDYRDVVHRVQSGLGTTHHSHPFVMDAVSALSKQLQEVAILCCRCQDAYNEVIYPGFRVMGSGFDPEQRPNDLAKLVADYQPTHLVVRAPLKSVLGWAIKNQVSTITLLADTFFSRNWQLKLKNWQLKRLLNHPVIDWVGNHGIYASRTLAEVGVNPKKIVPWDWPHLEQPLDFAPKQLQPDQVPFRLIYVGSLIERKGVGDVLRAIANLKAQNIQVRFQIVGKGERSLFESQATQLGIEGWVEFVGTVPTDQVISRMAECDLVIVPSRHNYPEGFPRTIFQGLCSRSPLVVSDHPVFKGNFRHGYTAMMFPAGDAVAMANCIRQLYSDPELYRRLSMAAQSTWQALQISVKWADFIQSWLSNERQDIQWLETHTLASMQTVLPLASSA